MPLSRGSIVLTFLTIVVKYFKPEYTVVGKLAKVRLIKQNRKNKQTIHVISIKKAHLVLRKNATSLGFAESNVFNEIKADLEKYSNDPAILVHMNKIYI